MKSQMFYAKRRGQRITAFMARDGSRCALCDQPLDRRLKDPTDPQYVTFDHKLPASRGGTDEPSNLRLAHRACNERRGNASDVWMNPNPVLK